MHPNESLLRGAYEAMAAGDGRTLAELLTVDTTWVIRGRGRLSGSYRGPDEIFALWKAIAAQTGGGLRLEVGDVLANDDRGVVLVTARGERNGHVLEERQVAVFEFANAGKVRTATFIYEDPDAYDAFWED
ncbi:MAG TPA: nuclear transport factor 2 family protein [Acidimicrobiales bacterium]|nr:nuclear transport factor 2 family protein [Acidimicrobiales bacterium]